MHCIIVGFSYFNNRVKYLFEGKTFEKVNDINDYLIDAPKVYIESGKLLSDVPSMIFGNMANDGGFLSNYSVEQKEDICRQYPDSNTFLEKYLEQMNL